MSICLFVYICKWKVGKKPLPIAISAVALNPSSGDELKLYLSCFRTTPSVVVFKMCNNVVQYRCKSIYRPRKFIKRVWHIIRTPIYIWSALYIQWSKAQWTDMSHFNFLKQPTFAARRLSIAQRICEVMKTVTTRKHSSRTPTARLPTLHAS